MTAREAPMRGSRQRQRTRHALLDAGQRLFATRSVDAVTIDDIVEQADVAKGSFYNHFSDKQALADAVWELVQGDVEFHIYRANQDVADPAMRAVRGFCSVLRYAKEHPDRLQSLLTLSARLTTIAHPLNAGLSSDIRHGIEQARFSDIDVATGVLIVIGLTRAAVVNAMSDEFEGSIVAFATDVSAAILRALGAPLEQVHEIGKEAARSILEELSK